MTTTENLGLTTNSSASGSAVNFETWRLSINGLTSNMTIIDNFAGETSASILSLQSNAFTNVNASLISPNYFEANVTTITSYVSGMMISLKLNSTITGSTTINISELGVKTLKKVNVEGALVDMSSGDLKLNMNYLFKYDGTYFVLIGSQIADQISIAGTPSNYLSISASGVIVDSGVAIVSSASGTFNSLEINEYGMVVAGSSVASSISGSSVMSNTTGSEVRHNASGVTAGSYNKVIVDVFGHVTTGSDVAYQTVSSISGSSVMSSTTGSEVRHNASGISSGSYTKVIVDVFGHVSAGSQVTGMSASGIEFYTGTSTGSELNIKNTVVIIDGLITSWTQS